MILIFLYDSSSLPPFPPFGKRWSQKSTFRNLLLGKVEQNMEAIGIHFS
jgi:hypothetical protein